MSDDADGFNDRQLFCFPPQRDVFLGELKLSLPSHLPALSDVYETVRAFHSEQCTYTFTDEGYQSSSQFAMMHLLLGRAARVMTPYRAFYRKQGGT